MRKNMPVARRVLGEGNETTLRMKWIFAQSINEDPNATLDDLREAVATLEETERTARRTFGGAHPLTAQIEQSLQNVREILRLRTE